MNWRQIMLFMSLLLSHFPHQFAFAHSFPVCTFSTSVECRLHCWEFVFLAMWSFPHHQHFLQSFLLSLCLCLSFCGGRPFVFAICRDKSFYLTGSLAFLVHLSCHLFGLLDLLYRHLEGEVQRWLQFLWQILVQNTHHDPVSCMFWQLMKCTNECLCTLQHTPPLLVKAGVFVNDVSFGSESNLA